MSSVNNKMQSGRLIHTFLSDRTQSITANGASSTLSKVKSSVHQGTVPGPILFLVLIGGHK